MKKLAAALFVLTSFGALSLTASADVVHLQLDNAFGGPVGGVYTYPYTFTVTANGSSSVVQLMCIDFTRDTPLNASWDANEGPIAANTENPPTQAQLDEDAYILSEILAIAAVDPNYGTNQNVEGLQYAAWRVLDNGATSGNSTIDGLANTDLMDAVHNAPAAGSSFYNGFTLFVPVNDVNTPNTTDPQRFLGYFPTGVPHIIPGPVPEPSSLMLLGTGVLGAAGMLRKRFVKA